MRPLRRLRRWRRCSCRRSRGGSGVADGRQLDPPSLDEPPVLTDQHRAVLRDSRRTPQWPRPPVRKPKKKVCEFCKDKVDVRRLQGHRAAPQVHLRPRQDPRPPGHRQLHPAPARRRHRGEERPRDGPAALHLHRALRRGLTDMKIILTQEVTGLGAARRHRRGQGRLRPQLPPPARLRASRDPWRREAVGRDQAGPRRPATIRDLDHAKEVKGKLEGSTVKVAGPRRRGRPPVRLGHLGRHRRRGRAAGGPPLDKRASSSPRRSRPLGTHTVSVRLHPEVAATVALDVVPA